MIEYQILIDISGVLNYFKLKDRFVLGWLGSKNNTVGNLPSQTGNKPGGGGGGYGYGV